MAATPGYKRISDYGVIGDTHSAALVGIDGSIDWACFPRFDSPSVFAAILDHTAGGRFRISPAENYQARQRYLPNTNVLVTTFTTDTGEAEILDFMSVVNGDRPGRPPRQIQRLVRCNAGTMELKWIFQPRFDYGKARTEVSARRHGVVAVSGDESMALSTDAPLSVDEDQAQGSLSLHEDQTATFVLAYGRQRTYPVQKFHCLESLARTQTYWEEVATHVNYDGPWKDSVTRSFLLLHLLMYSPSGAMVAAPTTSLPEQIGGQRNWDYRYAWLRDSAFALDILYRLGDRQEAGRFYKWLLRECRKTTNGISIVYGIDPASDLHERKLEHLEGYKGSRPVRIGNSAASMRQLDIFGEVILSIATYQQYGGEVDQEAWSIVESFARLVCKDWHRPDQGVWEIRGRPRHFVYSKVMCWVALNRAVVLARVLGRGRSEEVTEWERTAEVIKLEVLTKGWSPSKQAFRQAYDTEDMDAANLIIPFVGFLPDNDPRVLSTIHQIRDELARGPLVRRYRTSTGVDGLPGSEGAFLMLSFWLIGALLSAGQVEEARALFEEVQAYSNHLGLFSEMVDLETGEALGNFPQAYSHIGLLHTVRNLAAALGHEATEEPVLA